MREELVLGIDLALLSANREMEQVRRMLAAIDGPAAEFGLAEQLLASAARRIDTVRAALGPLDDL